MEFSVWVIWHIFVLLFMVYGVYGGLQKIQNNNMLRQGIESIYERINMLSGSREDVKKQLEALYGSMDGRGWIAHISDCLEYSGLMARFAWLTPELYVVLLTLVLTAAFIGGWMMSSRWYMGIGAAALLYLLTEYVFGKMRSRRLQEEEAQLTALINLVESYAAESDDLIYILHRAGCMIDGPLKEEIQRCVLKVRGGMKTATALRTLENHIEHPFFKTFIRNLEISSRNNAEYGRIVEECRRLLLEQLENSRKMADIYRNARIRLVTILTGSVMCMDIMAEYMMGTGLVNMLRQLSVSIGGRILLTFMGATLSASGYYALVRSRKR